MRFPQEADDCSATRMFVVAEQQVVIALTATFLLHFFMETWVTGGGGGGVRGGYDRFFFSVCTMETDNFFG